MSKELTLRRSLELAGNNLLNILSPVRDYLPYWSVKFGPDRRAACWMVRPEHNVGRWWDAMLRLEATTGFAIPAAIEAAMLRNLTRCLENELAVCVHLEGENAGWIDAHSLREMLLSLAALVRYRNSRWALETGSRMVRALDRYIGADGIWDSRSMARIARRAGVAVDPSGPGRHQHRGVRSTETHGRMIEALLEFSSASGDDGAFALAARLAPLHLAGSTRSDGTIPAADYVHTHSLLGTLRGLLMFGQLTRQAEYVERVYQTYVTSVQATMKRSGFLSHDWGEETNGETAAPGDAAQIALHLARSGYVDLFDDVERIVRNRILATQITEPIGLLPAMEGGGDEYANLDARALGAYGGVTPHPHGGSSPITDITAANVHTLCDIYRHVVETTASGLLVNLHFDYQDSQVTMEMERRRNASLYLWPRTTGRVLIRMPAWTPSESTRLGLSGTPLELSWVGSLLLTIPRSVGDLVEVRYDLPVTTSTEQTDGQTYRLTWRGDEVVGISPNTDFLPFYRSAS